MVAQKGHLYSMAPSLRWGELMPFDVSGGSVGNLPRWHHCKSQQLTVGQDRESLWVMFQKMLQQQI